MVREKSGVQLSTQEKGRLRQMIRAGRSSVQAITRAGILLKTDEGWTASRVAAALDISERTVFRAKRRYAEEGLDEVLRHRNQVNSYRKLNDRGEAHLIALACSPAPEGHDHWTLRLLAGKAVELGLVESLSHETVRLSSRWISLGAGFGSPFNGKLTVLGWRRRGRPAGPLQEETIAARPGHDSVGTFSWPVGGPVADEDVRKGVAGHAIGPGRC